MKKLIILLFISQYTFADMPYISNNTSESYERVTSGDIVCESRQSHPTLNSGYYSSNSNNYYNDNDKGVYVSVSIPLTSNKNRVDCKGLYDTALTKERIRVKQLEMQLESYKSRNLTTD